MSDRNAVGVGLVIAAAIALHTTPAAARGGHCHEVSRVVGYQRCRSFGTYWQPPAVVWELGFAMLHFEMPHLDETLTVKDTAALYHVTSYGDPLVIASGPRLRVQYAVLHPFYLGSEMTLGFVSHSPPLAVDTLASGAVADTQTSGLATTTLLLAGTQATLGRVLLGTELAIGARTLSLSTPALPPAGPTIAIDFALEARARAGIWLTRWLTVSAVLGTSLIARDDYSVGISLGLHMFPYDGTR